MKKKVLKALKDKVPSTSGKVDRVEDTDTRASYKKSLDDKMQKGVNKAYDYGETAGDIAAGTAAATSAAVDFFGPDDATDAALLVAGPLGKVGKVKQILSKMRDPQKAIKEMNEAKKARAAKKAAEKTSSSRVSDDTLDYAKMNKERLDKLRDPAEHLGTMKRDRVKGPTFSK